MSVNVGQAVGYLDLDTTKFKAGFKSALADLKVFQSSTATSQDKLKAFGSAATSTGRSLTKGLTVPLAAIGAASVAVTARFDKGMSEVKAISGATGKEFDSLREKAIEMGAKTKFSASESAEAFKYMAMAGWKAHDMMEGIEGIMNLAAASGEELGAVSDIVTDSLTAFGLQAKDSAHFADVLAAAASNSNTNVGLMGETFKYVAPVAGALGYSIEDVSTAIGIMANSGIKGSQAGTSLRRLFTSLAKPTGAAKKAFKELGIEVADSNGKMKPFREVVEQLRQGFDGLTQKQKAQYAATIAGQYGMSGLLAIVNTSEKDYKKLARAIDDADGSAEKMANTMMDNLPGSLTLAKSALEGLGIRIGSVMTPALKKLVDGFTKFISWLSQASDGTIKFAVALGTVLASIGPLLLITGHLAGAIVNLTKAYEVLNKVALGQTIKGFASMAAAKLADAAATTVDTITQIRYRIATSGIGQAVGRATSGILAMAAAHRIAIVATLGIIGPIALLVGYMLKTGTSADEMAKKITAFADNLAKSINGFANEFPGMVDSIVQSFTSIVDSVVSVLPVLIPALAKMGIEMIKALVNSISQTAEPLVKAFVSVVDAIVEAIPILVPAIIDAGITLFTALVDAIPVILPALIEGLIQVINAIVAAMPKLIPALLQGAVTLFMAIVKAIPMVIPPLLAAIPKLIGALRSSMAQGVSKVWAQVKSSFVNMLTGMISDAKNKASKLRNTLLAPIQKVVKKINSLKAKLSLKVPSISVSGGKAPWGIGGKGKKPSFKVTWHALGGIFSKPTLLAGNNGLHGVGEAGAEAIIPLAQLWKRFDSMLIILSQLVTAVQGMVISPGVNYAYAAEGNLNSSVAALQSTVSELSAIIKGYPQANAEAFKNMTVESNLILDSRVAAKSLSKPIQKELNLETNRANRKKGETS